MLAVVTNELTAALQAEEEKVQQSTRVSSTRLMGWPISLLKVSFTEEDTQTPTCVKTDQPNQVTNGAC